MHIQKDEIGLPVSHGFDGFHAIRAFGNDLDVRMRLQQLAQNVTGEFFVVDDHHRDFL